VAILTFLDSGVLISAWRGIPARKIKALTILNDLQREFICAPFVKLELLPKPLCFGLNKEVEFYEDYFAEVSEWIEDFTAIYDESLQQGAKYGLGAMDALHIAAALLAQADEFITAERPTSPILRVAGLKIWTIY
jgi:predicted nucleic acid-binding protein